MKIMKASLAHHVAEEQCVSGWQLGKTKNMVSKELGNRITAGYKVRVCK